ncbi:MAG: hypothetical protein ACRCVA_32835 [Phreatobacter sp.]
MRLPAATLAMFSLALAAAGVASVEIVNRTPAKAAGLAERLARAYPHLTVSAAMAARPGADLIVNATSFGLAPDDPLPIDPAVIAPGACVAEALIAASPSALGRAAIARGARHLDGRPMLNGQVMLLLRHILPESFSGAALGPVSVAAAAARPA